MRIAITGGISVGKSFVCRLLKARGIAVYDCDEAAKRLMAENAQLRMELKRLVGDEVYCEGKLQKRILANFLLSSADHQKKLEAVVHPYVAKDFEQSDFHWLESAIFFDSGFYRRVKVDKVLCVMAPEEVRIMRIMERDKIAEVQARDWISKQMPQKEVAERSDFVIVNDGICDVEQQIDAVLQSIAACEKTE